MPLASHMTARRQAQADQALLSAKSGADTARRASDLDFAGALLLGEIELLCDDALLLCEVALQVFAQCSIVALRQDRRTAEEENGKRERAEKSTREGKAMRYATEIGDAATDDDDCQSVSKNAAGHTLLKKGLKRVELLLVVDAFMAATSTF
jgi:hypothetical protein